VTKSPYCDGLVPAPVGVVLVHADGRRNATTVTFFSEVAHHPTSMWVSLNVTSLAHELVQSRGDFTLSVLSKRQRDVALACGTASGRDVNKCAALDLTTTASGFLYLQGAVASTACRIRQAIPIGDHTVFIADLVEGERDTQAARLGVLLSTDL
jgi:flavin reductase (DIM6/NTAB) family NADH-FMN oxidoreductase RutF